jgi:rRNA processing protein Gar1
MVPLVTVRNAFQARVVVARLGSAGVVARVRGPADGPYPIGDVSVDVPELELELARQLMLADEVEAVFDAPHPESKTRRRRFGFF